MGDIGELYAMVEEQVSTTPHSLSKLQIVHCSDRRDDLLSHKVHLVREVQACSGTALCNPEIGSTFIPYDD